MARSEGQNMVPLYLAKIFWEDTDKQKGLTKKEIIKKLKDEGININDDTFSHHLHFLIGDNPDCFRIDKNLKMDIKMVRDEKDRRKVVYKLESRIFELSELKLLVDAVQSTKFITQEDSKKLIGKLKKLTSKSQAKDLQRDVLLAGRVKTRNQNVYDSIDIIHMALRNNRKIKFKYFKLDVNRCRIYYNHGKEIEVSPWYLHYDNGNYYLIAYNNYYSDQNNPIQYRVDRMENTDFSRTHTRDGTEIYIPRDGKNKMEKIDKAIYTKQLFGMYGGEIREIILEGYPIMANTIFDRFGEDIVLRKSDNEYYFRAHVKVAISPQFYSWVAGLDGKVWITEPEDVVEEMKRFIIRNQQRYYSTEKITLEGEADMEDNLLKYFKEIHEEKNIHINHLENDHISVSRYVALTPAFFYWLFSFEGRIWITAPQHLVKSITEQANEILDTYSSK